IAMYPDGQEAWSEFRRTGFPKVFPVVVNLSGGQIPNGAFIKRLPFPQSEYQSNAAGVATGVSLLGGPDNGGTPLWWDKN
ncbi:MAG TPA: SusD/RagB family nutrient-binding outer membrane lipoprotein, partial [Puia sp.]|nr:SusD/RagB family nutrient-binding outer membrane lipoprotein [Puia sp.]